MQKSPPSKEGFTCLCAISGAHGIKGELRFKSFTDIPTDIAAYGPLSSLHDTKFDISNVRYAGKNLIGKAAHVTDRTQAEQLKGTCLYVSNEKLPELSGAAEAKLIGLPVVDEKGNVRGEIAGVFSNGAHDVLEIKTSDDLILIPDTDEMVQKNDQQVIVSAYGLSFFSL